MDELKQELANYKRHKNIWRISRVLSRPYLTHKLGYKYDLVNKDFKSPYIVLSNHNSNFDSFMIALSFPKQMYYMASEQLYRAGFKSKLLKWAYEPISKIKGASDVLAVTKALRKLKKGQNICLFPEGNRSFNGKTYPIYNATGKLVKISGAGLITYRIEGEYLSTPRWGTSGVRKGKTYGKIVNYYTAEQLKQMSVEEVTKAIQNDLYENAFERQEKNPIKYVGKNKAEGMECAVCVCPECKTINSIATKGDTVYCKNCGVKTDYDDYGFFGEGFKFHNITQWDEWQTEFYKEYIANFTDSEKPLFYDENVKLSKISDDHEEVLIGKNGTFKFFRDRIEFGELKIETAGVSACSVFGRSVFCFTDKTGTHYELRPDDKDDIKNFRKYTSAFQIMFGLN